MVLDCRPIITGGIESICLCTQAKRERFFAAKAFRDEKGCLRQVERFLRAHSDFLDDDFRDLLDHLQADQCFTVLRKETAARAFVGELAQLGNKRIA